MKLNLHIALCLILSAICVNVMADNWVKLGTGYFRDTLIDDSLRQVTIYQDADDGGKYRIEKPYADSRDDMIIYTDKCENWYDFKFSGNYKAYFDSIQLDDDYYGATSIMHLKDFEEVEYFDNYYDWLAPVRDLELGVISYSGNGKPGIIQLASCCDNKAFWWCGGHIDCCGVITIFMPGEVVAFKSDDADEDSDNAYINCLLGSDIDHARLYVCYDGYSSAENLAVYELSDYEGGEIVDSNYVKTYQCEESGDYIIQLIGYDKNNSVLSVSVDTFRYIAPVNVNDEWIPLKTGNWELGYDIEQSMPYSEVKSEKQSLSGLILYQSEQNPYTFKIGSVWGDNDFYFTMTESIDLNTSSALKWKNQKTNMVKNGEIISFNSVTGPPSPYDGCVYESFLSKTKYDSKEGIFCFPLTYYKKVTDTIYEDWYYNDAFFTITGNAPVNSGISSVNADKSSKADRFFNVNGQETHALHHGLNIVKSADGSSKVVIKK